MPRRISRKDSKEIFYAYRLGFSDGKEVFGAINSCLAYVGDNSGNSKDSEFGSDNDYRVEIIIGFNNQTKFFDKYTRIWVNECPRTSDDAPDYVIVAEPEKRDGQILITCESSAINHIDLYYLFDGKIITFEAIDDLENGKFYVLPNVYLPIDIDTKMWYLEPVDENDENGTLKIIEVNSTNKCVEYSVELDG